MGNKNRSQIPDALKSAPRDKKMSTHATVKARLATPVTVPKNKPLTAQEWKFVQEVAANFGEISLKEAALRAGYNATHAKSVGSMLTDPKVSPHVVGAIQEMRQELAEVYGTTYERHMRDMQRIRDAALAAGNFGAAVQAEFRRGQALGTIYVERKEVRYGTIDSMSKDEVQQELQRLKDVYGQGQMQDTPSALIELSADDITVEDDNGDDTGSGVISAPEREPADDDGQDNQD
jgi:phage terminase small subunit